MKYVGEVGRFHHFSVTTCLSMLICFCVTCVGNCLASCGNNLARVTWPIYRMIFNKTACRSVRQLVFYSSVALEEARDINTFLKPLRRQLEDMEQYDFTEIEKVLPALMHTIGLIWANSKFYCRPARIIVLLQEMCNMLIEMVRIGRKKSTCGKWALKAVFC